MEFFDSGHLASGLGDLDAVADEDGLEVDAKEAWVEPEDQSAPGVGELVQIQGRAMEEVQEPVVAGRLQAQSAHDAGDAEQIFASGESGQQRDIHRKVRERAQAERNSHTRFHQSYQSMSGLLAGWLDDWDFGLDNCPGKV